MKRRDFIKTSVLGTIAAGTAGSALFSGCAEEAWARRDSISTDWGRERVSS
ncbi:MAG: twin-arginine translocation signal domain-containing protein [Bacteroidales bacterium]|nr:twin-arginine translocation signal domain-containing protein [Bacteroidales bacterium]